MDGIGRGRHKAPAWHLSLSDSTLVACSLIRRVPSQSSLTSCHCRSHRSGYQYFSTLTSMQLQAQLNLFSVSAGPRVTRLPQRCRIHQSKPRTHAARAAVQEAPPKDKARPGEKKGQRPPRQCQAEAGKSAQPLPYSHCIYAGFVEEMRFAAMKLHTREQAPKEGSRPETENPTPKVCQLLCPPCHLLQAAGCSNQTDSRGTGLHTHPRGLPPVPGRVQKGLRYVGAHCGRGSSPRM